MCSGLKGWRSNYTSIPFWKKWKSPFPTIARILMEIKQLLSQRDHVANSRQPVHSKQEWGGRDLQRRFQENWRFPWSHDPWGLHLYPWHWNKLKNQTSVGQEEIQLAALPGAWRWEEQLMGLITATTKKGGEKEKVMNRSLLSVTHLIGLTSPVSVHMG